MIEYVEYTENFKDKVIEFWIKICVEEYGFKHWENDIRNMDNHLYKENGGNFWLAIENNDVVGTISLEKVKDGEGILKGMYVAKEYRKQRIAYNLWNILLEFVQENEYKKIQLDTYEIFESAIKFYQKLGFIEKEKIGEKYVFEKQF